MQNFRKTGWTGLEFYETRLTSFIFCLPFSWQFRVWQWLNHSNMQSNGQAVNKVSIAICNLFVTSKNKTTNSPIHEFKVPQKGQRAILMVYYFLFITLKIFSAFLIHFKGFTRHFATLKISKLVNSWFRFFCCRKQGHWIVKFLMMR